MVWRGLQAAKRIAKTEVVGGTDYKYWRSFLRDLSDEQLLAGLKAVPDYHDFFGVSAFKRLCVDCHNEKARMVPPERRLVKTETPMTPEQRKAKMRELRERVGI